MLALSADIALGFFQAFNFWFQVFLSNYDLLLPSGIKRLMNNTHFTCQLTFANVFSLIPKPAKYMHGLTCKWNIAVFWHIPLAINITLYNQLWFQIRKISLCWMFPFQIWTSWPLCEVDPSHRYHHHFSLCMWLYILCLYCLQQSG